MNGNDNRMSPEGFTANRNRNDGQSVAQNQKPRFKIKDGNIIRINPDGTTTSRPLTDDERRRLEEARMNAARQRKSYGDEEAARRRADQKYLARNQSEAAQQLGVTNRSPEQQRRRREENIRRENRERQQKRRKVRINPGAVVFVLLMAVVVTTSVRQIRLNEATKDNSDRTDLVYNEHNYSETGNESEYIPETQPEEEEVPLFTTVSTSNSELYNGDLILVNYEHAYVAPESIDLTNAYEGRTGNADIGRLKVSQTTTSMESEAFSALESLVVNLKKATGTSDLMIVSGYRTYQDQVDIYDGYVKSNGEEYAKAYVANPGYSEHQTGLACDLTFYTSDGYSVPIPDYEYGSWIPENCMYDGFVRRYPEDKVDITGISYEAWHFRYVGVPHAYAMTTLNYCLEEYLNYLKEYTADTKMLHIKDDMSLENIEVVSLSDNTVSGGWLVYYVPVSSEDATDIPVLNGYSDIEISGNNYDGYIVTVTLN